MPKLDLESIPQTNATGYPPPHDEAVQGRWYRRIGPAAGLTDLAASHVVLKPGAWSSQRHWHAEEDEMVIMLEGEAVLVEDGGETLLKAGDIATWAKAVRNGHVLQNRSDSDCIFVALSAGDTAADWGEYSDIDMKFVRATGFTRKDGTPF